MKDFTKLTFLSILMIIIIGLYFEFFVNRPLNLYIQYLATGVIIVLTIAFVVYFVKQIMKILNP
jgi:hypothetical protein